MGCLLPTLFRPEVAFSLPSRCVFSLASPLDLASPPSTTTLPPLISLPARSPRTVLMIPLRDLSISFIKEIDQREARISAMRSAIFETFPVPNLRLLLRSCQI